MFELQSEALGGLTTFFSYMPKVVKNKEPPRKPSYEQFIGLILAGSAHTV
jgi:hypothetical protein